MPDRCEYHEQIRDDITGLRVEMQRVSDANAATQKEVDGMQEAVKKLSISVDDLKLTINRWMWSFTLLGGVAAVVWEFAIPFAKGKGWI